MTADVLLADVVQQRDLNEVEARALIDGMRVDVAGIDVRIKIAFHGRAWVSLGYSTWDAMCEAEFDGARLRIPREDRAEQVQSLRSAGLSTRAIGSALGLPKSTVADDLATARSRTVEQPTEVRSLDGRTRPATKPPRPPAPSSAAIPAGPTSTDPGPSPAHAAPPAAVEGSTSPPSEPTASVDARPTSTGGGEPDVGTVPFEEHPDYQPSNADLDRQLEDELSSTDERFRSNLVRACAPTYSVLDLSAARVIETYLPGSTAAEALDLYLTRITGWTDEVRAGLRPRNLRSVR